MNEQTKREYEQSLAMLAEQQNQLRMAQEMHEKLQESSEEMRIENERKDFEYAERMAELENMLEQR